LLNRPGLSITTAGAVTCQKSKIQTGIAWYTGLLSMRVSIQLIATFLLVIVWTACGTPGAPMPPSLQLPRPVEDLTAARKGPKVYLTWASPHQTTDGANLRRSGPTRVCRSLIFPMGACSEVLAELPPHAAVPAGTSAPRREFTDTLPAQLQQEHPTGFATYAVEAMNTRDRTAGLSNQVRVPLVPTLRPPAVVHAEVTQDGVVLTWSAVPPPQPTPAGLKFSYRVYRRVEGSTVDVIAGQTPLDSPTLTDHSFEWEKKYLYRATVVSTVTPAGKPSEEVEGDDSASVQVFVHDIFPPAVPVGLQAVASGVGQKPFVDLTWAPDTDPDLAGYNVYRKNGQGEWTKLNTEMVKTPSYRDTDVVPGHRYTYSVTAVDVRGNESHRSEAASETVP
jgi:hypothetical protein